MSIPFKSVHIYVRYLAEYDDGRTVISEFLNVFRIARILSVCDCPEIVIRERHHSDEFSR